jgi:hypothetical protein
MYRKHVDTEHRSRISISSHKQCSRHSLDTALTGLQDAHQKIDLVLHACIKHILRQDSSSGSVEPFRLARPMCLGTPGSSLRGAVCWERDEEHCRTSLHLQLKQKLSAELGKHHCVTAVLWRHAYAAMRCGMRQLMLTY